MVRVTNDLNDIGEVAHHGPEDIFIAVMTLLGSFSIMAYINLELALLTFVIVPIMAWVILVFGRRMTTTYRKLFGNIGNFNARIEENVGGIRVVQSFANEDHEKELFAKDNMNYRSTKLLAYKTMAKSISLSYMMMRLITIFVLVLLHIFAEIAGLMMDGEKPLLHILKKPFINKPRNMVRPTTVKKS